VVIQVLSTFVFSFVFHFIVLILPLFSHYFINGCFMDKESQLIDDAVKISHIPVTIIQGRYDIVCPPDTAWKLYKVILTFNSPIKIKINKNTTPL